MGEKVELKNSGNQTCLSSQFTFFHFFTFSFFSFFYFIFFYLVFLLFQNLLVEAHSVRISVDKICSTSADEVGRSRAGEWGIPTAAIDHKSADIHV